MIESTKVKYAEIWGLRKEKNDWLEDRSVENTKWEELEPQEPYYFFVPRDREGWDLYQDFWKVTDIFPTHSIGIVTARDDFAIDFDKNALESRIRTFINTEDRLAKTAFGLRNKKNWTIRQAQQELKETRTWQEHIIEILYRPFDERWIIYHPAVIERDRRKVMKHMLRSNLALVTCRQQASVGFRHTLATDTIIESCYVSNKTREIGYTFPLYLYDESKTEEKKGNPGVKAMMLFDKPMDGGYQVKRPNIDPKLLSEFEKSFDKEPSPEEIFYYIYAVLYSNTYRQKYQEFLKIDFPRVPFTKDYQLFQKLAGLGKELVDLHLLKSKKLERPIAKFQGRNDNMVEKREYKNGRVYINDEQYFEGIKPNVWEYQIGGYQVLDKWLKDRKGRTLSLEDVNHYCRVVTALQQTIRLQRRIDLLVTSSHS